MMEEQFICDEKKFIRQEVEKMREFSFNINNEDGLKLFLKEGTAEIFGRELPQYTIQQFQKGDRFSIFTWTGCVLYLEYMNDSDFFQSTDESQYPIYANINQYLHELRSQAQDQRKIGPKILICGPNQSGKTTVSKTLTNYCCKLGWTPVLVDLDPMLNTVMAGGCIGACVCKDSYPSNGIEIKNKIVFFHGYSRIQLGLLKNQIEVLGNTVQKKLQNNLEQFLIKHNLQVAPDAEGAQQKINKQKYPSQQNIQNSATQIKLPSGVNINQMLLLPQDKQMFSSGCIINMPPLQSREQKEVIDLIIKHFQVDVIIGLDDQVFNSLKQNQLLTNGYSVIRSSKPSGLKTKEESELVDEARKINQKLFQQYFKGLNNDIDCHNQEVNLNDLMVYRLKINEKNSLASTSIQQQKQIYERVDLQKENVTKSIVGVLNLTRSSIEKLKEEEVFEKISKSTLSLLVHLSDMRTNQPYVRLFLPGLNMENIIKENVCVIGDITWFESSSDKKK
ncbi:hypothetical protein ABPG72_003990 [Tetrahymena utriculariae]